MNTCRKNLNAKFIVQYSIYWVHIQTNVTPEHSNTPMNWIIQLIDKNNKQSDYEDSFHNPIYIRYYLHRPKCNLECNR